MPAPGVLGRARRGGSVGNIQGYVGAMDTGVAAAVPKVSGLLPDGLPPAVADCVEERCRALAAIASGRVLEVPAVTREDAGSGSEVAGDRARRTSAIQAKREGAAPGFGADRPASGGGGVEALLSERHAGERYDTILSLVRTPFVEDIAAFLTALDRLMAPGGRLLMVEPTGGAHRSAVSLVAAAAAAWAGRSRSFSAGLRLGRGTLPPCRGPLRLDHDVVAELWARGFAVTDLHHFQVPSAPPKWRRFAELRARRATPWSKPPQERS